MKSTETMMSGNECRDFTENGELIVRRTDRFGSGNVTDKTIEQDFMTLLKSAASIWFEIWGSLIRVKKFR